MYVKQKILYCASNDIHIKNFHLPYLKFLKNSGFEVHLASRGCMSFPYVDIKYDIPFEKNIFSSNNLVAFRAIKDILQQNRYQIISIHTTLAGAITRLALMVGVKKNARIIYTSHGYFFWNGAPLTNWVKYLVVERICASVTDCVLTMNQEDFVLAQKYRLSKSNVELIPGMGVDLTRFKPCDPSEKQRLRREFKIRDDEFLVVFPAEMSKRKNHRELLLAFAIFIKNEPNGRLLLPGDGLLLKENKILAKKLGIEDRVTFLGYVDRMEEIYQICDLAVSSAISEGLPLNIIEAMACGLPVVASRIRGHTDLIEEKKNGFLYTPEDSNELSRTILNIYACKDSLVNISIRNIEKAKEFGLEHAEARICDIYKKYM